MKEVMQMKSPTKIVSKMILLVIVFTLVALACHFSKSMALTVFVGSIVSPILTVRFYFLLFDLRKTLKRRKSDVGSNDWKYKEGSCLWNSRLPWRAFRQAWDNNTLRWCRRGRRTKDEWQQCKALRNGVLVTVRADRRSVDLRDLIQWYKI